MLEEQFVFSQIIDFFYHYYLSDVEANPETLKTTILLNFLTNNIYYKVVIPFKSEVLDCTVSQVVES